MYHHTTEALWWVVCPGKWQEGRPRWVEQLQQDRMAHEMGGDSHAEAVDLCLEAARMARDAGVEGALHAEQHWLPQGTMQVCAGLLAVLQHCTQCGDVAEVMEVLCVRLICPDQCWHVKPVVYAWFACDVQLWL